MDTWLKWLKRDIKRIEDMTRAGAHHETVVTAFENAGSALQRALVAYLKEERGVL